MTSTIDDIANAETGVFSRPPGSDSDPVFGALLRAIGKFTGMRLDAPIDA